jgi:LysM repeat protein
VVVDGRAAARIAAPVAFLLLVTIAVLLVRAGLREGNTAPTGPVAVTTGSVARVVVRRGDTLERIAERSGTTVAVLRRLNPRVDPVELRPGQRIRVR